MKEARKKELLEMGFTAEQVKELEKKEGADKAGSVASSALNRYRDEPNLDNAAKLVAAVNNFATLCGSLNMIALAAPGQKQAAKK